MDQIENLRRELDAIETLFTSASANQERIAELEAELAEERKAVAFLEEKWARIETILASVLDHEDAAKEEKEEKEDKGEDQVIVHHYPRPTCPECEQSFSTRGYLRRHQNKTGHKGNPYACKECGERFSTGGHLTRHKNKEGH